MLFLDIDGTVLDTQNRISPNLKQLFKKLNQEEISIVLNSSRSPSGSMETRRETGLRNPCICYGGGLVVGDKEQIIAECGIPVKEALEFYRFVQNLPYDISVNFFVYDVWITDNKADPMVVRESDIMGLGPVECNLESIGSFAESIHKILCIGSHEALEELVRHLAGEHCGGRGRNDRQFHVRGLRSRHCDGQFAGEAEASGGYGRAVYG